MRRTHWKWLLLAVPLVTLLFFVGCKKNADSTASDAGKDTAVRNPSSQQTGTPAEVVLDAELQTALAARKPKQLWAENFFSEQRQEAQVFRYETLDCLELCPELLELLFPDATVNKKRRSPEGTYFELKEERNKITCSCEESIINIGGLPSKQAKELMQRAVHWLAEKTGLEHFEWTGYDKRRIYAAEVFTGSVDGLPIGATVYGMAINYGLWRDQDGYSFEMPISVGEQVGSVRLYDQFSQEELRMLLEFGFDPSQPVVEVYRSCELCYLLHEQKGLLVPVWWVKGTRCNYETGKETTFEIVFDAETGSIYDFGGV